MPVLPSAIRRGVGFDVLVVLMCAAMWLVHGSRLVRMPLRRSWPAFVIVNIGGFATIGSYVFVRPYTAHISLAAVIVLLIAPALSVRAASRALRFGHIARARALSRLAFVLRPLAVQRRFRRAVEISWRLSRGEAIDVDRALSELDATTRRERALHQLAFLSWSNDFAAMAHLLERPQVRKRALVAGMTAIVTTVVGETGTAAEMVSLFGELADSKALSRRSLDSTNTLLGVAAYLGDAATVALYADDLRRDVPHERVAFLVATAQQRAGDIAAAESTVATALASAKTESGKNRLLYRRAHPAAAIPAHEAQFAAATVEEVRRRLRARQVLSALGVGFTKRSRLTWAIAAVLVATFIWETGQNLPAVFRQWGLVAPYAEAPEPFRLLTYAVLHVDAGHLLVNLAGLLIFGRFVEHHYGLVRYTVIYVVGAVAGAFAFLFFSTRLGIAIGASGAVLALFGATLGRLAQDKPLRTSPQGKREVLFLVGIAVAQMIGDLLIAQSSGSAHAGGFLAGFLVGALLSRSSAAPRALRG